MCGIIGIFSSQTNYTKEVAKEMLKQISHRGPDDQGINEFNTSFGKLVLGHKRLSILDLSSLGHQPMSTKDKILWITYNGEIFNFQEIRETLRQKGYTFHSNTDTEVILATYREYGIKCLNLFRGFFAFCIYDREKEVLFLARDRLGSKPLKYYFDGNTFAFTSELKAFHPVENIPKHINIHSISQYLSLKYIPAPATIFSNIFKLCAGNYMLYSLKHKTLEIKKYWEPIFKPKHHISYQEAKEHTKELLEDAINIRLISDVPVGIFLSGGIDSSSIVALLKDKRHINTFSVGFNDSKFDERHYAKRISEIFHTHHQDFLVEPNLKNDLESIVNHYDEPFADPSIIPTYYLAHEVSKHVKVILGGDGADEMLGGYKRYSIHSRNRFLDLLPQTLFSINQSLLKHIPYSPQKSYSYGKISRLIESLSGNLTNTYYLRLTGYSKKEKYHLFNQDISQLTNPIWNNEITHYFQKHLNLSTLDRLMAIDQITHLPEYILTKADISTMANSLEARAPFIDVKFIEWINKLDASYKTKFYSKRILKDILQESGVPPEIIHRKKAGFTPPLKMWLKEESELLEHFIFSDSSSLTFLSKKILRMIYNSHIQNGYNLSNYLWVILVLGIWLEKNKKFIDME